MGLPARRNDKEVNVGGSQHAQRRIVVAEQDDEIRQMLAAALRADGYDVIEATNGLELLDHLGTALLRGCPADGPDAIIMDALIPGIRGLSILNALREADWPSPIVLLVGERGRGLREEPERLGANAVFKRPFDIDDVRTVVLNIVPRTDYPRAAPSHA